MLIGRKTFDEMQGWFTDQTPLVLTRQTSYSAHSGALVTNSVADAIKIAEKLQTSELVVAGGAAVYEAALPYATKLVLTWIETENRLDVDHPVFFPSFNRGTWVSKKIEQWPADDENSHLMTLEILEAQDNSHVLM